MPHLELGRIPHHGLRCQCTPHHTLHQGWLLHAACRTPHATRRRSHAAHPLSVVRWWHIWHSFVSVLGPVFSTARQGLRILHSCFLVLWHVETPSLFCLPVVRAYFERHSLRPTPLTLAPRTHTFHIPPPPPHKELKPTNHIWNVRVHGAEVSGGDERNASWCMPWSQANRTEISSKG